VLHFLFSYEGESVERLKELVRRGTKRVTIFEMQPRIGGDVGRSTRWVLAGDLERLGVHVITGARVMSIRDGLVSWRADGCDNARKFDAVVVARVPSR
jgi:2,4-dienoyl-CoA reductase (NADPH2)